MIVVLVVQALRDVDSEYLVKQFVCEPSGLADGKCSFQALRKIDVSAFGRQIGLETIQPERACVHQYRLRRDNLSKEMRGKPKVTGQSRCFDDAHLIISKCPQAFAHGSPDFVGVSRSVQAREVVDDVLMLAVNRNGVYR